MIRDTIRPSGSDITHDQAPPPERDGVPLLNTVATGWIGRDVLVRIDDDRVHVPWLWVDAGDATRR